MTTSTGQPPAWRRRASHLMVEQTRDRIASDEGADAKRPAAAIAHVHYYSPDLDAAETFWRTIGLRYLLRTPAVVIFEMAGGTHLIVSKGPAEGGALPFQLMVDDLEATRARLAQGGLKPSEIVLGEIHDGFMLKEPSGRTVQVLDSHTVGIV